MGAEVFGVVLIGGLNLRNGYFLFGDANSFLCLDPDDAGLMAFVDKSVAHEVREMN
ncbi:hypothetical protein AAIB41_18010 [Brucella sp. BE17]|uniref:hypothetical protein n=1 Tax=Brucella sp. BE17 TaxID=3142977 RepID=UPI0031BA633B